MMKTARFILSFVALLCLLGSPSLAQQTLGSISGTVTDSSGGVVQGATVKIHNLGTGLEQTAKTRADGSFSVVDLPIGTYSVTTSRDGFKTEVHSQILVQGNRTTTVNVSLQPGEVSATITVSGTPLLNQVDTTNGYTLGSELIENIPLGTGSFTQLAILSPGVSADFLSGAGVNAGLGNQDIFANGQRDTSNSFSFNSVTSNNLFNGLTASSIGESRFLLNTNEQFGAANTITTTTSVFDAIGQGLPAPPPETLQEVTVNTSLYGVSQGANSGAHVSVLTKSGTNDFHGGVYGYHQSTGLDANQFFLNAVGIGRQPLHRNVFGGTIGGPIKKDKLFFFGSYQGQRITDATNGSVEFANVPCSDPANPTPATCLSSDRSAAGVAAATGVNVSQVDPVALAILQAKLPNGQFVVPSASKFNLGEIAALGGNAEDHAPPSTFKADQANGNVDYIFSQKDRIAAKYYFQNDPSTSPFAVSQVQGFAQTLKAGSQVFSLDNTTVLTPNTTWEQRLGFIRQFANATTAQQFTPSSIGINLLGGKFFPGFEITNAGSPTGNGLRIGPGNNFANAGAFQNHFQGASNYNWVLGHHALSFGFDADYGQLNIVNRENEVAIIRPSNFANFLTGTLGGRNGGGTLLNGETNRYYRAKQTGLFAQDSYKLQPNLTITAGLRWDWDGPLYEKNGLLTNFSAKDYNFNLGTDTISNIGLVVAGNNKQFCGTKPRPSFCVSDSTLTGRQWLFEPRIGLAWTPSHLKNVVVRTGFGLYADRGEFFAELSASAGLGISGPFGVTTEQPFTVPFNSTCTGQGCLAKPFGTTAPPLPPSNFSGVAALVHNLSGLSGCTEPVTPTCVPSGDPQFAFLFGGYDPRNTLPYSENWTLDVQWQPYSTLLFDVGYVGNHGVHQLLPIPFNQPGIATPTHPINGQIYSYGYQATSATGGTLLTEQVATTIGNFTGADGNTALRVPFVGYNPNSDFWKAEGISNYHALQFSVKKLFSHGLMINASYTWSHVLDEGSGLAEGLFFNGNDPLNPRSAYGSAGFDRTHVFTISYLYKIPDLTKSQGFLKHVVNGWGVSGITTAETGLPYSIYDFSGTVGSQFFSGDDFITNPLLAIPGGTLASAKQNIAACQMASGNPGGIIQPINPCVFGVTVIAPGTNGVPPCGPTTDNASPTAACDFSETGFTGAARNSFRGPFQTRFDASIFKNFKLSERVALRFDAQFFNLFNHPSFDAANNNLTLDPCDGPNTQTAPGGFSCPWLGNVPAVAGSGILGNGTAQAGEGVVQNTLGSPRLIQFALHLTF